MAASVTNSPAIDPHKAKRQAVSSQRQVLGDRNEGGPRIIAEEQAEERKAEQMVSRSPRRRTSGFDPKALSESLAGSFHGRSSAILHSDH